MIRYGILILLFPIALSESLGRYFIIWNVGQGSWASLVTNRECWHFDVGGKIFPRGVQRLCQNKDNFLFLSHDDWDHITHLKRIAGWPRICLFTRPRKSFSAKKKNLMGQLPPCPKLSGAEEIVWTPKGKNPNDLSRVYFLKNPGVLIPGDSPRSEEKIWSAKIRKLEIKFWLLGHHGSLTSSSKTLISVIGRPLAISSAKWTSYRHPHPIVEARLRRNGIPLLRTEDWGHIGVKLD